MNTVYGVVLSPFVRKVLMAMDYKKLTWELIMVVPHSTPQSYSQMHPLQKIPAFKDDYVTLCDSSVICDYLENRYPQSPLYPKNPADRARALWLEEFADTKLFELLGPGLFAERVVVPARFKRASNEQIIQKTLRALPQWLDYLEREIPSTGFLLGPEICIADLIIPGLFLNAHYADYEVDDRLWPRLSAYLQRMWAHPLYQARMPDEKNLLAKMGVTVN
jgi:glutathione S-transferase